MSHSEQSEVIAASIRSAMDRGEVRLSELAERTGIPKSTLSDKVRGQSSFSVAELVEIAAALGVPASSLLDLPGAASSAVAS